MIALCFALAIVAGSAADVALPATTSYGHPAGLIIAQAAGASVDSYIALANYLQKSVPVDLYVAIPEFQGGAPSTSNAATSMSKAWKSLTSLGLPSNSSIFVAAHHSAGFALQEVLLTQHSEIKFSGLILLGSFIQRRWRDTARSAGLPILTVGAELDGLCRVSRLAESYYHQIHHSADPKAAELLPVVVIEGMNHAQLVGAPSAANDLASDISQDTAWARLASVVGFFMSPVATAGALSKEVSRTGQLVRPFLEAMDLEGSANVLPPCYDNPPSPTCMLGSPWTQNVAQPYMGGLNGTAAKIEVRDEFHPAWQLFPFHHPKVTSPKCNNTGEPCVVAVTTVTQNVQDDKDAADEGFVPIAAVTMRMKLMSRQAILQAAGHSDAKFEDTDAPELCAEINTLAIEWALAHASDRARQRYEKYGQRMVVGPDLGPYNMGPQWIWIDLSYKTTTDAAGKKVLEVSSPTLKTATEFPIDLAAGFHFCKGLSPLRVLEWVYTDSQRA